MAGEPDWQACRADTPGTAKTNHLLACGSSLMPQPVIDTIIDFTRLEAEIGGYEAAEQRQAELDGVYDSLARHIGADRREIALLENATVAWCHAFYALPLKPGARILTCEAEYAANYVAMLQRAERDGLTIDVIPSDASGAADPDALERMIDGSVGLIAITWIPTNGGLVNPAAEIGAIAARHGIPYLLDACQAAGQLRIDVDALNCDFLSATGRKFLRGPRGTGFLYVRKRWLETLEPAMIDHFGAPWTARDRYTLRDDARRFETWENNYALRAGLGVAIDYLDRIGIDAAAARISRLADHCRAALGDLPGAQVRDLGRQKCGIVSFSMEGADPKELAAALRRDGIAIGTSTPDSTRIDSERRNLPELLRIAPHYYNTEAEIENCIRRLSELR